MQYTRNQSDRNHLGWYLKSVWQSWFHIHCLWHHLAKWRYWDLDWRGNDQRQYCNCFIIGSPSTILDDLQSSNHNIIAKIIIKQNSPHSPLFRVRAVDRCCDHLYIIYISKVGNYRTKITSNTYLNTSTKYKKTTSTTAKKTLILWRLINFLHYYKQIWLKKILTCEKRGKVDEFFCKLYFDTSIGYDEKFYAILLAIQSLKIIPKRQQQGGGDCIFLIYFIVCGKFKANCMKALQIHIRVRS